jgi:hypothetical protein
MPHYHPPEEEAHGLIVAHLKPNADSQKALSDVRNLTLPDPKVMQIATASYLKKEQPANKPVEIGDVIGAFVNAISAEPIQSAQAHADMDKLVQKIKQMPHFTADIKHW